MKTRFSWSKSAFLKAKENRDLNDHPFYVSKDEAKSDFLKKISNFKPTQSLMELKDLKNHPNEEALVKAISSLRKKVIKKKIKDK